MYILTEVKLSKLEDINKHSKELKEYLNNYIGTRLSEPLEQIEVFINNGLYFRMKINPVHLQWYEGRIKIYMDKHKIEYCLNTSNSFKTDIDDTIYLNNGKLKVWTHKFRNIIFREIEPNNNLLFINPYSNYPTESFNISNIYISGHNVEVTKLYQELRYRMFKEGDNTIDEEYWLYLRSKINPNRVKIVLVCRNRAIDLRTLKYLDNQFTDKELFEMFKTKGYENQVIKDNLFVYENLSLFHRKVLNLTNSNHIKIAKEVVWK